MNSQRCLRQSSRSLPMVLLVALLTTPVMARNEGNAIQEPAQPQPPADPALQIFVVGDGTPASCTKDAIQYELWAALAVGGGRVFFNCGPDSVTIPIDSGSSGQPLSFSITRPSMGAAGLRCKRSGTTGRAWRWMARPGS